ncbi:SusD/RagB family nutrient-binding outer membrane lipoprotein [Chitinophaga sp. 22620]|uniref:SusD/RagB family nutrient-binding outer membrane lipoprotein n=1 Tax=Chitinophaga sp. 22620 TaxID=3453952 RepID=UPI003F86A38A
MMMRSSYKKILYVLCLALLAAGCKKGWLDVNYNPRDLTNTEVTPDLMLAPVMERSVAAMNTRFLQHWMGYWCYYQFPAGHSLVTYNRPAAEMGIFPGQVSPELPFLEARSMELGQTFYAGIAKALKVVQFQRVTDVVNNMPYTDAFDARVLQPRYDDAKLIYESMMRQLDTASRLIKEANVNNNLKITIADIMFHGDQPSWLRFINTLKLRLLVHQANRSDRAAYISAEVAKIMSEGSGFLESGKDASINPGYMLGKNLSYYFGCFSNHNQYGGGDFDALLQVGSYDWAHANVYAMNLLKGDDDPRLGLFYSTVDLPLPAGAPEPFAQPGPQEFRGNQYGNFINASAYPYQGNTYVSAVGGSRNNDIVKPEAKGIIKGRDMADWIMTSIESKFLQAEAVQRGWIPGDAETAYKEAVKESFRWLNAGGNSTMPALSDAIFDTWYAQQIANPRVSWAAAPDKYKLLMYQKYMAFNGIEPLETWTDYRRNGRFPDIPASVSPQRVGNVVPFRLLYNRNEYIVNANNVNAQGTINIFTSKIWWMP